MLGATFPKCNLRPKAGALIKYVAGVTTGGIGERVVHEYTPLLCRRYKGDNRDATWRLHGLRDQLFNDFTTKLTQLLKPTGVVVGQLVVI